MKPLQSRKGRGFDAPPGQPPIATIPSGHAEPRLLGHTRIRILCLPSDGFPLLMEAPDVMAIAVDTAEHVYPMQIKDGAMRDMWLSKTERT